MRCSIACLAEAAIRVPGGRLRHCRVLQLPDTSSPYALCVRAKTGVLRNKLSYNARRESGGTEFKERSVQVREDQLLYFATDLTDFLACRHLCSLERLTAYGLVKRPFTDDPMLELLRARGLEHEAQYVSSLRQSSNSVIEVDKSAASPLAETLAAMRSGAEVIVQARLEHG